MTYFYRLKCLLLLIVCSYSFNTQAQQLPHPQLWLKANQEVSLKEGWQDQSEYQRPATASSAQNLPSLTGEFNYHQVLEFDGKNDSLSIPLNLDQMSAMTYMAVYYSADTTERALWATQGALARPVLLTTQKALGPDTVIDMYGNYGNKAVLATVVQNWDKGQEYADSASLSLASAGNLGEQDVFSGRLAELLIFDEAISFLARKQYETYLAIKFGVPVREGNYVSSQQEVLWKMSEQEAFAHRLAGLGRDDVFGLYQKQSRSMLDTANLLVISAAQLAKSNKENTAKLADQHFLIWGDNDQAYQLAKIQESDTSLAIMERKWLMSARGQDIDQLATELRFNIKGLPKDSLGYWLVVDRSGKGNFAVDNLSYYLPDSIQGDTLAIYKNVRWDTDRSGTDQFSLARAKNMLAVVRTLEDPTCLEQAGGLASVEIIGGKAPYYYTLNNQEAKINRSYEGAAKWELNKLVAGTYSLNINDGEATEIARSFSLHMPDELKIDLGEDQRLEEGGEISLNAGTHVPDTMTVSYQWESNFGFSSTNPEIQVTENGVYTVTITTEEGCQFTDEVAIAGANEPRFMVFPTVNSVREPVNVGISLTEPGDVLMQVHSLSGTLKGSMQGRGSSEYHFRPVLDKAGMYLIIVDMPNGRQTQRVVVQ